MKRTSAFSLLNVIAFSAFVALAGAPSAFADATFMGLGDLKFCNALMFSLAKSDLTRS